MKSSASSSKIFMKYHALFVIFEKAAKFKIVVCCKLQLALNGSGELHFWSNYLSNLVFLAALMIQSEI